jgi:tetratricopeptide (TPR) repeat protein
MIAFLEAAIRRDPENVDAMAELGHAYTAHGRYEDGLRLDERLVGLLPDHPIVHYNLGCSLALLGRREAALEAIEEAVARGFDDLGVMLNDEDLASLRDEERFQQLAASLEQARS